MRILHVSDCFLPRLGGIEVQVDGLARAQRAAGHDVAVATATPERPGDGAGAVPPFPVDRLVAPLPWELPVGRSLAPVLGARKPDVVHVHAGAVSPFAWRAVRRAGRAGVPVVLTVHSLWGPFSRACYRVLFAAWARRGGLVVTTVSEAAAVPIRRVVDGRVPVRVVSNGIDVAHWREDFATHAHLRVRGADRLHVVAVGRLAPRKEPMRLLRLLRDVGARAPIRATVVGDGPARRRMERYARRHRMGWVRFTGRLDRPAVRAVLAGADVFLAPASRESFGLAALEARLAGLPVVARAASGVADFVEPGREGLLGRSGADLAAALLRLAADPALRHGMAAHNRTTAPVRCTWPAVLSAFDGCYEAASAKTPLAHL
ncbi:glycosyltransferase family 4 protein [Actinomadura parmotrematis]|uniref:Glycosyltransferase family 4 protein n=1 Tax=Actinomadura parmotrematis TaxID=2864039 RepID=A0ABS7FRT4_9ACTN|nr:glycosyltransferase family 4 protein [Actinomadura parmotrematis]MBW8483026.1 glycosyltransferase family 4 protein [Actinomadura parmotrematis]